MQTVARIREQPELLNLWLNAEERLLIALGMDYVSASLIVHRMRRTALDLSHQQVTTAMNQITKRRLPLPGSVHLMQYSDLTNELVGADGSIGTIGGLVAAVADWFTSAAGVHLGHDLSTQGQVLSRIVGCLSAVDTRRLRHNRGMSRAAALGDAIADLATHLSTKSTSCKALRTASP